jgi:hypothetical protein
VAPKGALPFFVGVFQGIASTDCRRAKCPSRKRCGVEGVAACRGLQILFIYVTRVTDGGLKHLDALGNLENLDLGWNDVSDAGLKELAACKELRALLVFRTKVTDAGLKHLAGLGHLQHLSLQWTAVTDRGLKDLVGCKELRVVLVEGAKVTEAGAAALEKARPGCRVFLSYWTPPNEPNAP